MFSYMSMIWFVFLPRTQVIKIPKTKSIENYIIIFIFTKKEHDLMTK